MATYLHRKLHCWCCFDRVEIERMPRWKESELSGDEWRFSWSAQFFFKGELVHSAGGHNLEDVALNVLRVSQAHELVSTESSMTIDRKDRETCDQPMCRNEPLHFFLMRNLYSRAGEAIQPNNTGIKYFRKFCSKHKERGDCDLDDADDNYEEVSRSVVYQ